MTNGENLDWLYRLKSEIYVYMPKEWLIPMDNALDIAIKALSEPTIPLSVIEDIKHEAKMKATTEEVLDEDLYKSSLNEDTSCDCAMDESIVETEVIILDKLFEIIDKAVKEAQKDA